MAHRSKRVVSGNTSDDKFIFIGRKGGRSRISGNGTASKNGHAKGCFGKSGTATGEKSVMKAQKATAEKQRLAKVEMERRDRRNAQARALRAARKEVV
jgi:hypothetical protein